MKVIALTGKARSGKDSFARLGQSITKIIPIGLADSFKRDILEEYKFSASDIFGCGKTKEKGYLEHPKESFKKLNLQEMASNADSAVEAGQFSHYYYDGSNLKVLVKHQDPRFWWSPREVMQIRGSEIESGNERALTDTLIQTIKTLLDGHRPGPETHHLHFDYDRRMGVYPWISQSVRTPLVVITDVRKPHQLSHLREAFPHLISIKINRRDSIITNGHASETSVNEFRPQDFDFMIDNDGGWLEYKEKVQNLLADIVRK